MNTAKQILLGVLGLVAIVQVGISGDMLRVPRSHFTAGHFCYPALLIGSVVYLHWLFRALLMPLSRFAPARRAALKEQAAAHYSKGVLAGTVGTGYVGLGLYVIGFLAGSGNSPETPNLVPWVLSFIALGTLAQVRGLVCNLLACGSHQAKHEAQETSSGNAGFVGAPPASAG